MILINELEPEETFGDLDEAKDFYDIDTLIGAELANRITSLEEMAWIMNMHSKYIRGHWKIV